MVSELINQTNYANIYGLYDDNGKPIGTKEVKLAGWEAGKTFYYSLVCKYDKQDIRKMFKEVEA